MPISPGSLQNSNNCAVRKKQAYRSGDKDLYKKAKYRLKKVIRTVKNRYSEKLEKQFSANDSSSVRKGLQEITQKEIVTLY